MNRIYTKTGDGGTTGIHGGARVPKDDPRIEANGVLDELNCQIGVVRAGLVEQPRFFCDAGGEPPTAQKVPAARGGNLDELLHSIQSNLMVIMSQVATPSAIRESNPNPLPDNLVEDCEKQMDSITALIGASRHFILPGGTPLAAQLQMARAICRRAERRLWTLHREDPLPEAILKYINRLSDLFFILARWELDRQQWPEEKWQAFAYKNQK